MNVMDMGKLHEEAMELAEQAILRKMRKTATAEEILFLNKQAYEKERTVALAATEEPTRSILLRSAATLALKAQNYAAVQELVKVGLSGEPPAEIRVELEELLTQIP
jgi:hypothetical protein